MELLKTLKQIRVIKGSYFQKQCNIYKELSCRYPFIMKVNMAKIINKLEIELQLLLCASLRFKSIKISLEAESKWGQSKQKTIVNIQRTEPGFYYSHSQRGVSDIRFLDKDIYIKDNYDLQEVEKTIPLVCLSQLKNETSRTYPNKVDFFLKTLKEIMSYKKEFLKYTKSNIYDDIEKSYIRIKKLKFIISEKSIEIYNNKERIQYSGSYSEYIYNPTEYSISHLLDYSHNGTDQNFSKSTHDKFKLFINNYKEINDMLIQKEKEKKHVVETCRGFLKQIAIVTTPFKVLNELTNKK